MQIPSMEDIRDLCTSQSFRRGRTYYEQGRIERLDMEDGVARATVRGTHDYRVTMDLTAERIRTECSCPYDYAGDCKHVVAVLFAVNEGEYGYTETETGAASDAESAGQSTGPTDVVAVIERTPADRLRAFLTDLVEDDRDVRDRFLAFVGADVDTSVYDYKREIDRRFDEAAGRGGMIEWDAQLDFSKYDDLAESYRVSGNYEKAAGIHRAVAEAVRENLSRVDDSSGHYGRRIAEAVESYAACIAEGTSDHEERREHVEYLVEQFLDAEYSFVSGYYADALRELCTTTEDLEYWRELLAPHVEAATGVDIVDPDPPGDVTTPNRTDDGTDPGRTGEETAAPGGEKGQGPDRDDDGADDSADGEDDPGDGPSADQHLVATDLATGPLDVDDFTGGTLEVEHLAQGPLDVELFVGDALDHLPAIEAPRNAVRMGGGSTDTETGTGTESEIETEAGATGSASATASAGSTASVPTTDASVRTRPLVSAALSLLEKLDDREATMALLDGVFLDRSTFCEQYAELLLEASNADRAIEVLEAGVDAFRSATDLRRRLVGLYRDRDPERYRHHLTELVVRDRDWSAYDELREACSGEEWQSVREKIVSRLDQSGRTDLIDLYLHEGGREKAFEAVLDRASLGTLERHASRVGDVDPDRYFEVYRDELAPFLANETGRRHYREVIGHLERMEKLGVDDRLDGFVASLKNEHSNRPAFLDELEKAGF